jgi:inorganic triphosphatase YgiF
MTAKVEVEIKYRVSDSSTVQELLAAKRLGPCTIDGFFTRQHHDTYLDTPDYDFMSTGFAYRYRHTATRGIVQLKSLDMGDSYVHRRTEFWSITDYPEAPQTWTPGPARDLVIEVLQGKTLQTLFEIHQIRHCANLMHHGAIVAEMSIDEIIWQTGWGKTQGWELEIEFSGDDDPLLMRGIDEELVLNGGLFPERLSKFERGLALLELPLAASTSSGIRKVA